MPDALAVVARFSTDRGPAVVRGVYGTADVSVALSDLAHHLEAQGMFPVKVLRVYRQTVPVVNETPLWPLAGAMERVPEGQFVVRQEMGE